MSTITVMKDGRPATQAELEKAVHPIHALSVDGLIERLMELKTEYVACSPGGFRVVDCDGSPIVPRVFAGDREFVVVFGTRGDFS